MHLGAFDDEPAIVALMDARKVAPEKWKIVIRNPDIV